MKEAAKQVAKREDVKEALEQTAAKKPVKAETRDKLWFVTHALLLLGCAVLSYLLRLKVIEMPQNYVDGAQRAIRGVALITLVLAIAKAVSVYAIGLVSDAASRYTLRRIQHLIVGLLVVIIAVSVVFVNWYTALISVGVISVIVGLSVQTPMTSFIGWLYILIRRPYRVGDRIQIGESTGDVIDVSYIDTTLWEFGGKYLSTDHPSGRIIKFPNSKVLDSIIYNYSWPLFPYIWNEIKFQIAYGSDLEFVASTMQRVVEEQLGEAMMKRVELYRELLAKTTVDQLEVRAHPRVIFRVSDNTWLEAIVRYLVAPRQAGSVKSAMIPKLLAALNAEPNRVMFPSGAAR